VLDNYLCVAHVRINTKRDWYPYRLRKLEAANPKAPVNRAVGSAVPGLDSTVYPVGLFDTVLATPEVKLALSNGDIDAVHEVLLYEPGRPFDSWVKYWSERRAEAKSQGRALEAGWCKLMMVGLAGKFAQRRRGWKNTTRYHAEAPWQGWCHYDGRSKVRTLLRSVGWQVQECYDYGTDPKALVALSAHIASYGRVFMRFVIDQLPARSVLYVANDALLVTAEALPILEVNGLLHPTDIGRFGVEGPYERARLWGPRDYELEGTVVKSGLPAERVPQGERKWLARFAERGDGLLAHPTDGTVRYHWSVVIGDHGDEPGLFREDGWYYPPVKDEAYGNPVDLAPRVGYRSEDNPSGVPTVTKPLATDWGYAKPQGRKRT
jgi:hypothetical protein